FVPLRAFSWPFPALAMRAEGDWASISNSTLPAPSSLLSPVAFVQNLTPSQKPDDYSRWKPVAFEKPVAFMPVEPPWSTLAIRHSSFPSPAPNFP
ncbi:MAG: hypothetical protein WD971_06520, partial [Pirellulales bacterium]